MSDKKAGADTHKFKMKPNPGSPAGIELDGQGNVIPFEERTEDDKAAAVGAGSVRSSVKNPEHEAEIRPRCRAAARGKVLSTRSVKANIIKRGQNVCYR